MTSIFSHTHTKLLYFPHYKVHFFHSLAGPATDGQMRLIYQNIYDLTRF